jgi:hypothetical protein
MVSSLPANYENQNLRNSIAFLSTEGLYNSSILAHYSAATPWLQTKQ